MNFIPKIEYYDEATSTTKTIVFDSPPEGDPFNEKIVTKSVVTKSNNGRMQTQFNYNELEYDLKFIFQKENTYQLFRDFYLNHASRGLSFDYYPSIRKELA